jgi:hypothetical protein
MFLLSIFLKQPDSFLTDILLQAEQKLTSKQSGFIAIISCKTECNSEIAIIASEDTHYSIPKAANLLMLDWLNIPVDFDSRLDVFCIENIIINAKERGRNILLSFQIWEPRCLAQLTTQTTIPKILENIS